LEIAAMGLLTAFVNLFKKHDDLVERVDRADQETRESKHKLRNLAMRTQALHRLFSEIKEDELWQRGMKSGRGNDKPPRPGNP
jgi:hypothetical protein